MSDIKDLIERSRQHSRTVRRMNRNESTKSTDLLDECAAVLERFVIRSPFITNCDIAMRPGDDFLFDAQTGQAFLDGYLIVPKENEFSGPDFDRSERLHPLDATTPGV